MQRIQKNILVVGGGGREHAICWALKKSPRLGELFCAPGNAGIADVARLVPLHVEDFDGIADFAMQNDIDLVVVGPDDPLAKGIVDHLQARGVQVFGPTSRAAQIEASKVFMKGICVRYGIPTAAYEVFDDAQEALAYVRAQPVPLVLKADGLAAGKGAIVAHTLKEAEEAVDQILVQRVFGAASGQMVVEEYLEGRELSLLAFVDGEVVRPMVEVQDYKSIFDGGRGPNTGGMGACSPCPSLTGNELDDVSERIVKRAAQALVEEGRSFQGVLFAGVMMTDDGPRLIEFNARFGDPEAQAVLPRLKTDLLEVLFATVEGRLQDIELEWHEEATLCVMLASEGYPGAFQTGFEIGGLDEAEGLIFHSGTAKRGEKIVTAGGRVLSVVGQGQRLEQARQRAYEAAEKIEFEGKVMRRDIGGRRGW